MSGCSVVASDKWPRCPARDAADLHSCGLLAVARVHGRSTSDAASRLRRCGALELVEAAKSPSGCPRSLGTSAASDCGNHSRRGSSGTQGRTAEVAIDMLGGRSRAASQRSLPATSAAPSGAKAGLMSSLSCLISRSLAHQHVAVLRLEGVRNLAKVDGIHDPVDMTLAAGGADHHFRA
jgi:hypothetical protein